MLPFYETDRTVTPTPVNPLGIKGAGETGTIAADAGRRQRRCRRAVPARHRPHRGDADELRAGVEDHSGRQGRQVTRGGDHMYPASFEYHAPEQRARSAGPPRQARGRRQAPGRRPQPHPDDEAAPGPAQAPDRPAQGQRAHRHQGRRQHARDRRHDHALGCGVLQVLKAKVPVARRVRCGDRRSGRAEPGHDRRLAGPRRPRGRHAGHGDRARRRVRVRGRQGQADGEGRRLVPGPHVDRVDDDEMLVEIRVPVWAAGSGAAT